MLRGQNLLLDGPQGLGRSGIAGDDHQLAIACEELFDAFPGETEDGLEGSASVRRARVVAQVDLVVLGQTGADAFEKGQTAEAGIENTDVHGRSNRFQVDPFN